MALSLRLPWPGVTRHRVSVEPGLSSARAQQPSGRLTWGVYNIFAFSIKPQRFFLAETGRLRHIRPLKKTEQENLK